MVERVNVAIILPTKNIYLVGLLTSSSSYIMTLGAEQTVNFITQNAHKAPIKIPIQNAKILTNALFTVGINQYAVQQIKIIPKNTIYNDSVK